MKRNKKNANIDKQQNWIKDEIKNNFEEKRKQMIMNNEHKRYTVHRAIAYTHTHAYRWQIENSG